MAIIVGTAVVEGARGYAQKIRSGDHTLTADEPFAAGGTNTGPSPYSLLLSGLGACTSITLRMYAERKKWTLGRIEVRLRLVKDGEAERIEREIQISGPLDEAQRARLLEIADKTPVTKSVRAGVTIVTSMVGD